MVLPGLSFVPLLLFSTLHNTHPHTTTIDTIAVGVDPSHHPLAGEPLAWEHHAGHAAEAGGLQRLPPPPQAAQSAGEVPAGDQLQHPADQTEAQQQARLHALRGKDGVGRSLQPEKVQTRMQNFELSEFFHKTLRSKVSARVRNFSATEFCLGNLRKVLGNHFAQDAERYFNHV